MTHERKKPTDQEISTLWFLAGPNVFMARRTRAEILFIRSELMRRHPGDEYKVTRRDRKGGRARGVWIIREHWKCDDGTNNGQGDS